MTFNLKTTSGPTLKGLVLFFFIGLATSQTNSNSSVNCESANTCTECIVLDPSCTWCTQINSIGCRARGFNESECPADFVEDPSSNNVLTQNFNFSSPNDNITIQLRPQKLTVRLRPGDTERITLNFRRVRDYPLDLYYVMDLSYSMGDDLEKLQALGSDIFTNLQSLSNNVRVGFGTFVDKVMLPFASTIPDQIEDPCLTDPDAGSCAPAFGFRHQLPLTTDGAAFIQAVGDTKISGNIDSPEGGFDALMQIAVCEPIQWRSNSLRVILYASDASPHIAMDGKLAAIFDINDMKCHLETNVHRYYPSSFIYTGSKIYDYPSVGQLKKVFQEQKIQPIFAVTEDVYPLYEKLQQLLDPAYVDILARDSNNIIDLISTSYNQIRTRVQLNVPILPSNVDLKYRVMCPDSSEWTESVLECSNVTIGQEVKFQFDLTALRCSNNLQNNTVIIDSNTIQDTVEMTIEYICECDCEAHQIPNSPTCNSNGTLECGICNCYSGFGGLDCSCELPSSNVTLEQNCTNLPYTRITPLCNERGTCDCGVCKCEGSFFGQFCQCTRTGCREDCGERGVCVNCDNTPTCVCDPGWSYSEITETCSCSDSLCVNPVSNTSSLCSGHGNCSCATCVCESQYSDQYCQTCIHPECFDVQGTCDDAILKACASCVYNADRTNREVNSACSEECPLRLVTYQSETSLTDFSNCQSNATELLPPCNLIDRTLHEPTTCQFETNGCFVNYRIIWAVEGEAYIRNKYRLYLKSFDEADCPQIDPLVIILPIVGGIILIGLILLIAWKIIQTLRDKREFEKFLIEANEAKFAQGKSGLYVDPNLKVENPLYHGED